jgi:hypothetical protein
MRLLRGDFNDGDKVLITVRDGQFAFERQVARDAATVA